MGVEEKWGENSRAWGLAGAGHTSSERNESCEDFVAAAGAKGRPSPRFCRRACFPARDEARVCDRQWFEPRLRVIDRC
jgi:hypothetical protein